MATEETRDAVKQILYTMIPILRNCLKGTSKNSGVRWVREILSPDEGEKTKEYFLYFKFLRQNQGAKDPASSHS